jgi:hypothetical protein
VLYLHKADPVETGDLGVSLYLLQRFCDENIRMYGEHGAAVATGRVPFVPTGFFVPVNGSVTV